MASALPQEGVPVVCSKPEDLQDTQDLSCLGGNRPGRTAAFEPEAGIKPGAEPRTRPGAGQGGRFSERR